MRKISIITFWLLSLTIIAVAQIPDPIPDTYINDFSKVTTDQQKQTINQKLRAIEVKYSIQVAIVLVDELPSNYEIEDYAREIGRKWHVGNARNGLVYVAAIKQHKQRLEVASNLEGDIPDIEAAHLTDHIKPFFRSNDYAGGLINFINEIDVLLNPAVKEQKSLAAAELKKKEESRNDIIINVLFCLLGIGGVSCILYFLFRRKKKEPIIEPKAYRASDIYRGSNYYSPTTIISNNNYSSGYSGYSSSSSDSGSSSSSSSDYGNWGSGSSDNSSSSDSGFSGGGSSNDW